MAVSLAGTVRPRFPRNARSTYESVNAALWRNRKISRTSSNRITVLASTALGDKTTHTHTHTHITTTISGHPCCRGRFRAACVRRGEYRIARERKPELTGTIIKRERWLMPVGIRYTTHRAA